MDTLKLTETVRSFLTEDGAAHLLAGLATITSRPGLATLTEWRLNDDCVSTVEVVEPATPLRGEFPGPLCFSVRFRLPENAIIGDVPEEHTHLIIHDGQVWTFGDLALTDVHRHLYAMDFLLSAEATQRMFEKVRATNPDALCNRPVWPNEAYERSIRQSR